MSTPAQPHGLAGLPGAALGLPGLAQPQLLNFPPLLLAVLPNHGPSAGANTVTLFGFGLSSATQVLFGTAPAAIVGQDWLGLTVTAPAGTGTVLVTVVTPNGTSIGLPYTYTTPPGPAVTGVFPSSGGASAGGTPFVVYGSNLSAATGVTFNGAAATNVLVAPSGTFIIGLTPAGPANTNVPVVVSFPAPTPPVTVTGGYTYGA